MCGCQRTTCGMGFFPPTMWVLEMNSVCQDGQPVSLPAQLSHWPFCKRITQVDSPRSAYIFTLYLSIKYFNN